MFSMRRAVRPQLLGPLRACAPLRPETLEPTVVVLAEALAELPPSSSVTVRLPPQFKVP